MANFIQSKLGSVQDKFEASARKLRAAGSNAVIQTLARLGGAASPEAKSWALIGQDKEFKIEFRGQFIAEGMSESTGSVLGENTTINKDQPNFQWLNGEATPFTFKSRIHASDSFMNIKQQVQMLKSFTRRNKDLRRAPIFLFTAGTEIGFTCFVKGVKILYDELREDGSIRGVVVDITLQEIEDTVVENAATSLAAQIKFVSGMIGPAAGLKSQLGKLVKIPGGSLHTIDRQVTARWGETFEGIAAAEYGQALLGDILRRVQPDKSNLKAGDTVLLVEASEIQQIAVTPQSVALKNTKTNAALRDEFLALRNKATTIFV